MSASNGKTVTELQCNHQWSHMPIHLVTLVTMVTICDYNGVQQTRATRYRNEQVQEYKHKRVYK